jgi:hypothetical protein
LLAANFIGQRLVTWWERLLARIPVVNSIYNSVKQVSDTLFSSSGNAFRKALLIEYPRRGAWTIAFLTGKPGADVLHHLDGDYVSVYVPTTPNPTSGFFLMLPKAEVIELDMSVDTALKYVISMGVVAAAHAAASKRTATDRPSTPPKLIPAQPGKQHANSLLWTSQFTAHRPGGDALRLGASAPRPRRRDLSSICATARVWPRSSATRIVPTMFAAAEAVRNEFCLRITGKVRARPEGTVNPNIASGEVEILCHEMESPQSLR